MTDKIDKHLADDIGIKLVDIFYSNTQLNYDVCAHNLVEVLEHLRSQLPDFQSVTGQLVESIQSSVREKHTNPDLMCLEKNLQCMKALSDRLQSGELNFYECNDKIRLYLAQSIKLISEQTNPTVFRSVLVENRQALISLFEMWQLSTNKQIKFSIVKLFNICFHSDATLIRLLYENTNLASEICYLIKDDASTQDSTERMAESLKCLITMMTNSGQLPMQFENFLRSSDFISFVLTTIESEKGFLYEKVTVKQQTLELPTNVHNKRRLLADVSLDAIELLNAENNDDEHLTVSDLLVHFLLAFNTKFMQPEENPLLIVITRGMERNSVYKLFSEKILNLFNYDKDPLECFYKLNDAHSTTNQSIASYVCSSSVLKLISDLFATDKTLENTSIFYSNDFNVLIDVVIRKLCNLSANDQIRVDFLSMIQMIVSNSNYMKTMYRKDDLVDAFLTILKEEEQTIDQDIIRDILRYNSRLIVD